jgi:thioesterase domain-containing protein
VKIRGMRVELGELESVLIQHTNIKQAVAVLRTDATNRERLIAYVVPRAGAVSTHQELRSFLKSRLPEYMLPAAVVAVDALPLTPSGKVDRNLLPAPDAKRDDSRDFAAPRTPNERLLATIWTDLLHLDHVGASDNFFELGGESLLAVQMVARARNAGLRLTPRDLFQYQTISELAAFAESGVKSDEPGSHPLLAPIKSWGDQPPLFCIHPIEGTVFGYAALARLLDTGQPVYGIRAAGLEPGEAPATRIEDMAAEYVDAITTVRRAGPYFLCGWSMGGLIAYEMARRFRELGEDIALLAILDHGSRATEFASRPEFAALAKRIEICRDQGGNVSDQFLASLRAEPAVASLLPAGLDEAAVFRHLRVLVTNWFAMDAYSALPSPEHIHLFRTETSAKKSADSTLGWAASADGGVEVHTVPGDHWSMMRFPHVAELARVFQESLAVILHGKGEEIAI